MREEGFIDEEAHLRATRSASRRFRSDPRGGSPDFCGNVPVFIITDGGNHFPPSWDGDISPDAPPVQPARPSGSLS
jgi:hypothetical protein